jgi:hypothetical protein
MSEPRAKEVRCFDCKKEFTGSASTIPALREQARAAGWEVNLPAWIFKRLQVPPENPKRTREARLDLCPACHEKRSGPAAQQKQYFEAMDKIHARR